MNSESIMHSDVLDIVFEKRNKLYGAYTLRKFYNHRLVKSLGVTLAAVTILSAFTLLPEKRVISEPEIDWIICTIGKTQPVDAKKQLPKQRKKSIQSSQKKFTTPVIKDSTNEPDFLQDIKITDLISSVNIALPNTEESGVAEPEKTNVENSGDGEKEVITVVDVNRPVDNPEIQPTYPGGINALKKFLERNLVNPKSMDEGELVGVNVQFIVGYDGKLQQFTVVKDGGEIFNNEVIRVLKKMPQWVPGKSGGQNVAVYFTIPVKFVPAD